MAHDITLKSKSMNMNIIFLDDFLHQSGTSIASLGGGIFILLTTIPGVPEFIFIVGVLLIILGSLIGLFKGYFSLRLKYEQLLHEIESREQDKKRFEDGQEAAKEQALRKKILSEIKGNTPQ